MHLLLTRLTKYPIYLRSRKRSRVQHAHNFNVTPSAQWPVIFNLYETFFLFVKPIFKTLINAGKLHSYISLLSQYLGDKTLLRSKGLAFLRNVSGRTENVPVCTRLSDISSEPRDLISRLLPAGRSTIS
jgi:hypothetical protein